MLHIGAEVYLSEKKNMLCTYRLYRYIYIHKKCLHTYLSLLFIKEKNIFIRSVTWSLKIEINISITNQFLGRNILFIRITIATMLHHYLSRNHSINGRVCEIGDRSVDQTIEGSVALSGLISICILLNTLYFELFF